MKKILKTLGKLLWFLLEELMKVLLGLFGMIYLVSCVLLVGPVLVFDEFGLWWGLLFISPWIAMAIGFLIEKYKELSRG